MRISDWSSDVCSSDLTQSAKIAGGREGRECQPFGNTPTHVGNGNVGACLEARLEWKRRDMIGERTNDVSGLRSEEHTSELQSLMRISYAVFCLNKKNNHNISLIQNTINIPTSIS